MKKFTVDKDVSHCSDLHIAFGRSEVVAQIAQYGSGGRQYISSWNLSVWTTLFHKLRLQNMLSLYNYLLLLKCKEILWHTYSKNVPSSV